jgi:hypothetical protein
MTRRPRFLAPLAAAWFAAMTTAPGSVAEESARTELPVEYFAQRKVTGDFD